MCFLPMPAKNMPSNDPHPPKMSIHFVLGTETETELQMSCHWPRCITNWSNQPMRRVRLLVN
jgi:hypothetical protein